jgi:Flp pilus assembly pilin Flp
MFKRSMLKFIKSERGVAAIEFAFILPVILVLYFGMLDVTQIISANRKVTSVADAMVGLVGQHRNEVFKTDLTDYYKTANLIINPGGDNVRIRVYTYRYSGSTFSPVWTQDNGKGPSCSAAPSVTAMNPLQESGKDLVVVQACYSFTPSNSGFFLLKTFGKSSFTLEQTAVQTPRAGLRIDCLKSAIDRTAC